MGIRTLASRLAPALLALIFLFPAAPAAALEDEEEFVFFRKLYADSLYEVAAGQMQAFLERRPQHPQRAELSWLLGRSYLAMEQGGPALQWLGAFASDSPQDPRVCEALYDAARIGVRQGFLTESSAALDLLLRDYDDCDKRDSAILLSARVKGANGDRAAALQLLSYLIESSGEEELVGRALFERATLKQANDGAGGRVDFEKLKATLPRHPLAGFAARQLAETARAEGRSADALTELDWLLRNFAEPDLAAPAYALKAELLADAERYEAAAEALAQRRERYPAAADAGLLLRREIELLTLAGRGGEAVERAREAKILMGETAAAYVLLAGALEVDGKDTEAGAAWERAHELDPVGETGLTALRHHFQLLLRTDDSAHLGSVSSRLLAALADGEERSTHLLELSAYYARRDRPEQAERILESIEGGPGLPEALYRLALLQEEQGRWGKAELYYRRLIQEHGSSARGLQAREGLEALERYYRKDETAAIERLLAMFDEERRQGAVRGREFKIGRLLRDELKEFPRAADYFRRLAAEQSGRDAKSWALLEGGRAELYEAERLRHAGKSEDAESWSKRCAATLSSCVDIASDPVKAEAEFAAARLHLGELPEGVERLPLLDALLAERGDLKAAARFFYERGRVYQRGNWTDQEGARAQALADFERVRELDAEGEWSLRASLGAAQLAFAAGDYERAGRHFQAIVDAAPTLFEGGEARFGLGQVAEKRKRFREALGSFETYLETSPTSPRRPRCLIHIGDCHYFLGEWDEARIAYRSLAEDHEQSSLVDDAVYRWALTEEKAGDDVAMAERLQWLLNHGDEQFRREAAWRLARRADAGGETLSAISVLKTLVALGPEGRHAVSGGLLLGRLLLAEGDDAGALSHYDTLLKGATLGEFRPEAEAGMIRALLRVGRGAEAERRWSELSQGTPLAEADHAELLLAFGRAAQGVDGDQAAGYFADCVARFPGSDAGPWALYELALMDSKSGNYDEAIVRFDQLIGRFGDHLAALQGAVKAAGVLYRQGQFAAASERYESAMMMNDDPPPELLYYSALAFEKSERYNEALGRVQTLLARHPEDELVPDAMMKVGYLLQMMGQFERATLAYRNAELFQDREGKARLHFWIGDCYEASGDPDAALAEFLKVGYMYGDQGLWGVTATLRAALLYERSGDLRQARQLFERIFASQGANSDFGRSAAEGIERIDGKGDQG